MKISILIITVFLFSCKGDKKENIHSIFGEINHISSTKMSKIEEPMIAGEFIILDSLLIVQSYRDQYNFHIIDPLTGKSIKKIIAHGKSSNESLGIQLSNYDEANLYLYDYILKSLIKIDRSEILSLVDLEKQKISDIHDFFFNRIYKIHDKRFLACGNSSDMESIFALIDENSNVIEKFGEFNLSDNSLIDLDSFGIASWGFVSISNNNIVYASTMGNIIKFYKIDNDHIRLINEYVYDLPNVKSIKNGNLSSIDADEKTINGTLGIAVSDKYCFLLNTYGLYRDNIRKSKYVLVFDWNGKPYKKIELDVEVNNISYSVRDNSLYAISIDKDGENIILKYTL